MTPFALEPLDKAFKFFRNLMCFLHKHVRLSKELKHAQEMVKEFGVDSDREELARAEGEYVKGPVRDSCDFSMQSHESQDPAPFFFNTYIEGMFYFVLHAPFESQSWRCESSLHFEHILAFRPAVTPNLCIAARISGCGSWPQRIR